jgi:hypothetical protein
MWEPRRLTPLWAFTACYRDSFTFTSECNLVITYWRLQTQRSGYILGYTWQIQLRRNVQRKENIHWSLNFKRKKEGKAVPVLYWLSTMPWRHIGEWRYNSTILYLGTRWRLLVSFTPLPLYPRGKSPRYPLDRRLGGPQSLSGHCGVENNFLTLLVIEPRSSSQ